MYLWDLDIKEYLEELKKNDKIKGTFPCEILPQVENQLIELYQSYAMEAQAINKNKTSIHGIANKTKELVDLDARLYYLIIEILVSEKERTYAGVIEEFEKYYKTEYLEIDPDIPFTKLRLIHWTDIQEQTRYISMICF